MNWKANILKILSTIISKVIIWKYKPIVIAITGNVGKSSTKEAVAKVVGSKYNIRYNELNYNNEFGIVLTIMGVDQKGSSSKIV
ncbi:MAG: hypothetical protein PHP14_00305 [Candidatus Pacebacteria bacterium]|nr:hypothetical protein [Candidatus Paceibacterota bacterium]MDD3808315.1 hypothetical protein [Candidatus Paceibacterota bacterium]